MAGESRRPGWSPAKANHHVGPVAVLVDRYDLSGSAPHAFLLGLWGELWFHHPVDDGLGRVGGGCARTPFTHELHERVVLLEALDFGVDPVAGVAPALGADEVVDSVGDGISDVSVTIVHQGSLANITVGGHLGSPLRGVKG